MSRPTIFLVGGKIDAASESVKLMNLTVLRKGLCLIVLPLLFQLAFVFAVVRFQQEQVAAGWWATHTKEVIARTSEINIALVDAHSELRETILALDPIVAEPSRPARSDGLAQFDELVALVQDNPRQADRLRSLRPILVSFVAWQGEVERFLSHKPSDRAIGRIRSDRGHALLKEFRRDIDDFLAEEERLDRDRFLALAQSRNRLDGVLFVGGALTIGCTLILGFVFHRGISRRFKTLEAVAHCVAAGDSLPPPLAGGDEIARVDQAFRGMVAELTKATERIRDLFDHAPCGYHSVGQDGTVIAVNKTELQWLGYEEHEVVGRLRFADFVHSSNRESYRATFAKVKEHGAASDVELDLVRKDGTTFPVLLNSIAQRRADGHYLQSRTTLTDLTELKRAQAEVRLFADVAENIPIGLLIYRLDDREILRVRSGNLGAARSLGVALDRAIGLPVVEVFPAIPEDQLRRYSEVAASGRPDDLGVFRYGDARVAERWWAVLAFPLPDRCVGIAFQDVSDRKRAEAEIHRLNEQLEDRVRERTTELETANRDLAQKNSENEMFVYSVSHDLRSPLVNLQGFSKELEKGCRQLAELSQEPTVPADVQAKVQSLLGGKMAKSIGFIQSAVLRLSGIIDALLRLSRVGRVEYRWEAVDLQGLAARIVSAAHGTIAERSAAIRIDELPPTWGDRTAIEQLFGNLIGNALTYLDPSRPGMIEVGCLPLESPSRFRVYFVRDNGLGIAEAHRQKIFQAFQRAHPGIGSGEGLGLAIVARVAERHRGRVWVESRPGEGSTFYVTLPATPDASIR